jgi:hypothetical protein
MKAKLEVKSKLNHKQTGLTIKSNVKAGPPLIVKKEH